MRRGLASVLIVFVATLGVAGVAGAVSCTLSSCPGFPILTATFDGSVSPRKLPRRAYVPVAANIFGRIAAGAETHPPALREAVIDIDKDVKINAKGYPVCKGGGRDVRDPNALKRICGNAILGEGKAEFEIAFPEQKPIKVQSPVTAFNGGEKGGEVTLAIITSVTVPAPREVFVTVTITRKDSGIHAVAKVPVIAGGNGSLLGFNLRLGRTYSYKGTKVGYFEAKCPDGVFKVNVPELLFRNEAHTPGVEAATAMRGSQTVPCTPYG